MLHSHWDHTLLGVVCVPSFKRLGLCALGHIHGSYMGEVSIKKGQLATYCEWLLSVAVPRGMADSSIKWYLEKY